MDKCVTLDASAHNPYLKDIRAGTEDESVAWEFRAADDENYIGHEAFCVK